MVTARLLRREIGYHVRHKSLERFILHELFVELCIVSEQRTYHTHERSVQFDTGRARRVLLGI
jgi:hypothetical protein